MSASGQKQKLALEFGMSALRLYFFYVGFPFKDAILPEPTYGAGFLVRGLPGLGPEPHPPRLG